jgi:hypothetical protein
MRSKLLQQLFADSALELLLVMAQHTAQARTLPSTRACPASSGHRVESTRGVPLQGPLRGEAPLLLEIFAALFDGVSARALLDAAAAQPPALPLSKPTATRKGSSQQKVPQRHPRFGGMFIRRLEGGAAQCAVGKTQHQDLLGPIVAANKAVRAVGCFFIP